MYIKVKQNRDGSHDVKDGGALENGWAVVPSWMEIPDSFPCVDITVDNVTIPSIDGGADITRCEVVSMKAGMPKGDDYYDHDVSGLLEDD